MTACSTRACLVFRKRVPPYQDCELLGMWLTCLYLAETGCRDDDVKCADPCRILQSDRVCVPVGHPQTCKALMSPRGPFLLALRCLPASSRPAAVLPAHPEPLPAGTPEPITAIQAVYAQAYEPVHHWYGVIRESWHVIVDVDDQSSS